MKTKDDNKDISKDDAIELNIKEDVYLKIDKKPLFVGSFIKIPVILNPSSGYTIDDLDFDIPAGPEGGIISLSRDKEFDLQTPDIMLCVGYKPNIYEIKVLKKGTNTILYASKYEVTDLWKDTSLGPSLWFSDLGNFRFSGSAWGGGPGGPQNINVVPAFGTRRIAILLVDTSSERYTSDSTTLQGFRDRWENEVELGVVSGGVNRSSSLYYGEASYTNFNLSAEVFGPVSLTGPWDDYFNSDGSPKGSFYQACFTAGDGLINYNNFDTLLCVSQSVNISDPDPSKRKSAWPYASIGNWGPYTTAEGNLNYGVISMPNEWHELDGRELHETFSHELGHNLGLGDQYTPGVAFRNPGGWELMDSDDPLPYISVVHRMMLGWVPSSRLKSYNFASMATPVDETITLHPIERNDVPAGRYSGIEIRLADGWNYYFEYRIGQTGNIGDRNLPTDNRILGTDVVSPPWTPPISRPGILLLSNDADGDGSVLNNGQDYEETDYTDPVYPTDFKVDVSGIDGTKANVRIRYGVNSKPDPSIRPWPASSSRPYQSPDIEIKNAKNMADSSWFNVPWSGNINTVIAKVKNNGTLDAPGVRVNFYVVNCNAGGVPPTFLGFDLKDIGAGDTEEFTATWVPPSEGHYCIIVRIPLYQHPTNPSIVEMTEYNNLAQSNYDRFISKTSIPSREILMVEVGNPYPIRTIINMVAGQTNPLYRTYLEHTWIMLDPGETKKIQVMFEYVGKRSSKTDDIHEGQDRKYITLPNDLRITSFITDPRVYPLHVIQTLGGAQIQIVTGKSTKFERFNVDNKEGEKETNDVISGLIVTDEGIPVSSGKVILIYTNDNNNEKQNKRYQTVDRVFGGKFHTKILERNWKIVQGYYVPSKGYADCYSEILKR